MMKHSWFGQGAALALAVALLASSCGEKKAGVIYTEHSDAERDVATAEAFAGAASSEVEPEIDEFFALLSEATCNPGTIDSGQLLSVEAMLEALESAGLFTGKSASYRKGFEKGFRKGIANIEQSLAQMSFDRYKVLSVEAPKETERLVYVRHYDTGINVAFPMRWWLVKTGDGWRIYDFEDLSIGLRTVQLMGALMLAGAGADAEPWVGDFMPLVLAIQQGDLSDPESLAALEEPLNKLRRHEMPEMMRRFASSMITSVYQVTERTEEAMAELDAARAGGYASPLWHYQRASTLNILERYEEALAEFEEHAKSFGWDSDTLEGMSDTYFELGRLPEARGAALRALEDAPGHPLCLASMAAASTPEQLADAGTAGLFAAAAEPEQAYETALDYIISLEQAANAEALFAVFRKAHPESELIDYYVEALAELKGGSPDAGGVNPEE